MRDTPIEWADDTVNAWWGCTAVSEGCRHCYAEVLAHRFQRATWGAAGRRWFRVEEAIGELHAIERRAERTGRPRRVFLQSMSDLFEVHPELEELLGGGR